MVFMWSFPKIKHTFDLTNDYSSIANGLHENRGRIHSFNQCSLRFRNLGRMQWALDLLRLPMLMKVVVDSTIVSFPKVIDFFVKKVNDYNKS